MSGGDWISGYVLSPRRTLRWIFPTRERRSRRWVVRRFLLAGFDSYAWAFSMLVAIFLRNDFAFSDMTVGSYVRLVLGAVLLQLVVGAFLRVYGGRHRLGTLEDALNVSTSFWVTGLCLFITNMVPTGHEVPDSVPVMATVVALGIAFAGRTLVRRHRDRGERPSEECATRVIVFGAGNEGQQLIRTMLSDRDSGHLPVALLDDDPDVGLRRFLGVELVGARADLLRIAEQTRAELVVIASRRLDGASVREIALVAAEAGLGVKVLPPLDEALRPWARIEDLHDLQVADLLGRAPVSIEMGPVVGFLRGHRVLVTGAGGSIGSELCRQIHRLEPAELLMLDRDESALHATRLSIHGDALLDTDDVILADIRDPRALRRIFESRRPQIVFHAAALKHLPLLQQYPDEAWETNVIGTRNVLTAAVDVGVESFINISTDKAANPCSFLGRSKRLGEMLVAHTSRTEDRRFLSVRFGNVLGSRGSVLTTFSEQIAKGSPVTVTHPDVTRFFMTISEAVQLVVYAGAIGRGAEVLILDMGEPVRIADVARRLMGVAGHHGEIVYTGLRAGEKLHEDLLGGEEHGSRPFHPAVCHVDVPPLDPAVAIAVAAASGPAAAMADLTGVHVTPLGGETPSVGGVVEASALSAPRASAEGGAA